MTLTINRRALLGTALAGASFAVLGRTATFAADDKITLRLSTPATATDQRAVALTDVFGPAVQDFATFEPHWNATLFKQGTELEAIARGNLEMSITSPQELASFIPEWSIFTAGYLLRDAEHQEEGVQGGLHGAAEEERGGQARREAADGDVSRPPAAQPAHLQGRKDVQTPADLPGVKLRMPGTDAWQFLGRALGANPVPMAFTEVYTALQTGAIDGQDNPLPTDKDSKFYEVTKQICLTSHLVDQNYLAFSKEVWDKLTPDQQATVQKAADDAAESGRQKQLALEDELAAVLQGQGARRLHARTSRPSASTCRRPISSPTSPRTGRRDGRQDQRALTTRIIGRAQAARAGCARGRTTWRWLCSPPCSHLHPPDRFALRSQLRRLAGRWSSA